MMLAGFLKGSPVEMVKCRTIDMEVPATAEVVLNQLYRMTSLQTSFPVNFLALDNGRPRPFRTTNMRCPRTEVMYLRIFR